MLIIDQLKKSDPQLRLVTLVVLSGLAILLVGLWWVQVVAGRDFQASLETQSFRTVRIPAVRGKILDRQGQIMAENRPTYNVSLYLEELRKPFEAAATAEITRTRAEFKQQVLAEEKRLGRSLSKAEKKPFILSSELKNRLRAKARLTVASNVVNQVSHYLNQPISFNPTNFERHYQTRLALPYPVWPNLDSTNIARFEEQLTSPLGVDLEILSTRFYPYQSSAAHLLGRLQFDDSSLEGEEAFFSYRLPDFRGLVGIEAGYDKELRGTAGAKSVLVNNVGYRQTENVWSPAEPGHDLVLTLDLKVQQAAEAALQSVYGPTTRGAVVVMDVQSGDVLAMVSSPTLNPNGFIQGVSREEWQRITSLHAEKNRATQENYPPGSVFKTIVGLAALEAGLNPQEVYHNEPNPAEPNKGHIVVGNHTIRDTAPPGDYNFKRALKLSSNAYFVHTGLRVGPSRIVRLAERVHLGERMGLPTRQEVSGSIPSAQRLSGRWSDGNTANLSIGQDPVLVTPLQIAVLASALANGGNVLWPRLVQRIEPQDPTSGEETLSFPPGQLRDTLGVSARSLGLMQEAMYGDTEDDDGSGRKARVAGMRIGAKTGTATLQDENGHKKGQTTWFASFGALAGSGGSAGWQKPRYAVVVMVEDGRSGGETCAPVAGKIYEVLLARERPGLASAVARTN